VNLFLHLSDLLLIAVDVVLLYLNYCKCLPLLNLVLRFVYFLVLKLENYCCSRLVCDCHQNEFLPLKV
jgi:hypothetical protein